MSHHSCILSPSNSPPPPRSGLARTGSAPRHSWPPAVLAKVVQQLVQETPRDLLARELWPGADTAPIPHHVWWLDCITCVTCWWWLAGRACPCPTVFSISVSEIRGVGV